MHVAAVPRRACAGVHPVELGGVPQVGPAGTPELRHGHPPVDLHGLLEVVPGHAHVALVGVEALDEAGHVRRPVGVDYERVAGAGARVPDRPVDEVGDLLVGAEGRLAPALLRAPVEVVAGLDVGKKKATMSGEDVRKFPRAGGKVQGSARGDVPGQGRLARARVFFFHPENSPSSCLLGARDGTPLAARDGTSLSRTVGLYVGTLVVGEYVGSTEGLPVGLSVGSSVGSLVTSFIFRGRPERSGGPR